MPQYARKTRQMITVTGIHPPVYADKFYTVVGSVQTLVGKTQYISKASGGTWPGADWITTLGPGHAMAMSEVPVTKIETDREVLDNKIEKEEKHHAAPHKTTAHHKGTDDF